MSETKNQRIPCVRKDLLIISSPTLLFSLSQLEHNPQHHIQSGNMIPCLTNLITKKYFYCVQMDFPEF